MKQQNRAPRKRVILLIAVWLVTVLAAGMYAWHLRSSQYRSYAQQSLHDIVLGGTNQIRRLIESSETTGGIPLDTEPITYQLYAIDATRRVLRNIYVEEDPGGLSTSPSVWLRCADAVYVLERSADPDLAKTFYEGLHGLCEGWVAKAELYGKVHDFEYELAQLEASLQALTESVLPE